jgi:RNA polymerase sigma factor (sigma-70 family)
MPIREREIKNPETGEIDLVPEEFNECFLGDTMEEAHATLAEYDYTIKLLANKVSRLSGADEEDLRQEGLLGLARAKRDFEKERSDTFRTFAIYKIKDAMREFVTKQAGNVKVPQYIKDAARLAEAMRKAIGKVKQIDHLPFTEIWKMSQTFEAEDGLVKRVAGLRNSLEMLAQRSCTSVIQLLDRADLSATSEVEITACNPSDLPHEEVENGMIDQLLANECVANIKELLSEEDYTLLHQRYVEERTIRELAPKYGITPESLVARTNNIKNRLLKNKDKILCNESDTNTEKTEEGNAG